MVGWCSMGTFNDPCIDIMSYESIPMNRWGHCLQRHWQPSGLQVRRENFDPGRTCTHRAISQDFIPMNVYVWVCIITYIYIHMYIYIYILYIYIYMYPSGKWWLAYLGYHCYPTTCHLPSDRPRTCNWFSVFQIHKSKVHAAGAHACSHDEFPRHRDIRGLKKLKERLWELRGNGGCLKIWTKLTSNFFDHFPYCHEMGNLPTVQKSS